MGMFNYDLDDLVVSLKNKNDEIIVNQLIADYTPFIIKTISDTKKAYVTMETDEFSIGMSAFYEAMTRYDRDKGPFLAYAKLVIRSRLLNFWENEKRNRCLPVEELREQPDNTALSLAENGLKEEIILFEKELLTFGIDFEFLAEHMPEHKDTKERAIAIGRRTSKEKDLTDWLYEKRRLPIAKMAERFFISVKIIKKSKYLITAAIIIILNGFTQIGDWIKINDNDDKNGTQK